MLERSGLVKRKYVHSLFFPIERSSCLFLRNCLLCILVLFLSSSNYLAVLVK